MKQTHFSSDEWQAFKQKTIEPEIAVEMEAHLQFCENCQEYYLGMIEQSEIDSAFQAIPLDFTDSLLEKLDKQSADSIIKSIPHKRKLTRRNIFAYYVTAAGLTLFLMNGGIFDSMVDQSMRFTQVCMLQSQKLENQVGKDWSSQLLENSAQLMHKLSVERERNVKDAK